MAGMARGCGTRVAGALYLTCPLSGNGVPLERFLIDPPIHEVEVEGEMVDIQDAWNLKALGVTIMKIPAFGPSYHVVDWIGAVHYPNVADFLEEVRRMGVSRRISQRTDFSMLDRSSRMIFAHPVGYIDNFVRYWRTEHRGIADVHPCPRRDDLHPYGLSEDGAAMCARYWWQDVMFGEDSIGPASRLINRQMPSFSYEAYKPPPGESEAAQDYPGERRLALIAAFPIHHIEAIKDREGGKHEEAMKAAAAGAIPVTLEEE